MTLRDNIRGALLKPCPTNILRPFLAPFFVPDTARPGRTRLPGSLRWSADRLGISFSHLSRIRKGERPDPHGYLEKIAQLTKGAR